MTALAVDRSAREAWGTGVRDALHAEWTKLRTVAGPGWLLLAATGLTVAVGAVAPFRAAGRCSPRRPP